MSTCICFIPLFILLSSLSLCSLFASSSVCSFSLERIPIPDILRTGEELAFRDDFNDFDLSIWKHDITMAGGGNWEFEWYTNNRSNSYVNNSILYLNPTLTINALGSSTSLMDGTDINIWGGAPADYCTMNEFYGCERTAGAAGNALNPVQSAKVSTVESFIFNGGRVELSARMPLGDWLWPAIWLMPRYNSYGDWPASGEVDIIESRGNNASYSAGGVNHVGTTLHFGPDWSQDAWKLATAAYQLTNSTFHDAFHVFGLYWDQNQIYSYVDDDSNRILQFRFNESLWDRAGWNSTTRKNPWENRGFSAPFDQDFYLIFEVAVGGTNGYFPDGIGNKPWQDNSTHASTEFWNGFSDWYPSWTSSAPEDPYPAAMQIDWVQITTLSSNEPEPVKNKFIKKKKAIDESIFYA